MQISALEVAKLLDSIPTKAGSAELEFKKITPDSLPKTPQPDPAEVARFLQIVKNAPDTREEIVMELKERIEKGEYNVSGENIADMMIRRAQADRVR